jgi:hypothetical protein
MLNNRRDVPWIVVIGVLACLAVIAVVAWYGL